MKMKFWQNRRFKHGSLSTVITAVFIAAVVLVNFLAIVLLERFPLNIDLTREKMFALSQESIDFVREMETPVTVYVCADEQTYQNTNAFYKQAHEIIDNYARYSGKIDVEYVDLTKDPNFAKRFPTESFEVNDIFLVSDLRTRKIKSDSLFDYKQNTSTGTVTYQSKAEQVMTGALYFVTDEDPATVALLTGLGNTDVSGYVELIEQNNYTVKTQNLQTEEIDPETAFVILPQPTADLNAAMVKKLEDYLYNGGNYDRGMVFVAAPDGAIGPTLATFLADWGVAVGAETIMETDPTHVVSNEPYALVNELPDEEFAASLKSTSLPFVSFYARPVTQLFETEGNRSTKALARSYDTAILIPVDAPEDFDWANQPKANYNTVVLCSRFGYVEDELGMPQAHTSYLAVFSTSDILDASLLNMGYLSNMDFAVTLTAQVAAQEEVFKILPVDMADDAIVVTGGQVRAATWIFVVAVPVIIMILGLVIWLRRRHL